MLQKRILNCIEDIICFVFIGLLMFRTFQYFYYNASSCWCGISKYNGIEFACCPGRHYIEKFTSIDKLLLVFCLVISVYLIVKIIKKVSFKKSIILLTVISFLCSAYVGTISDYKAYICNYTGAACSNSIKSNNSE